MREEEWEGGWKGSKGNKLSAATREELQKAEARAVVIVVVLYTKLRLVHGWVGTGGEVDGSSSEEVLFVLCCRPARVSRGCIRAGVRVGG